MDGLIEDEGQIGNLILEEISGVLTSGLSKVVTNLLASIKLQAYSPPLPIETDRIHVANGTYFMNGSFTADKSYCNNRLTAVGSDHRQRRFLLRPDGHDFRRELCIFLRLNCQKTHLTDLTYFILVYHNAPYFSTETNVKTAILQ